MSRTDALSFEQWKSQVNQEIVRISGLEADDLADYDYWMAWDAGEEPKEVALEVLVENGFPDED